MKLQNQIMALTPENEHNYVWPSEKAAYRAGAAEIQSAAAAVAANSQANEYQALESQLLKLRVDYLAIQVAKHSVTPPFNAAHDVLTERQRQICAEGWTPEHDDEHADYSLAQAGAAYAIAAAANYADRAVLDSFGNSGITASIRRAWPDSWNLKWFKPKSRRHDLVRAAALLIAEIERIDRGGGQSAGDL